jgi:hypothetical protein
VNFVSIYENRRMKSGEIVLRVVGRMRENDKRGASI